MGRPLINDRAMTAAERQRRHRAANRGSETVTKPRAAEPVTKPEPHVTKPTDAFRDNGHVTKPADEFRDAAFVTKLEARIRELEAELSRKTHATAGPLNRRQIEREIEQRARDRVDEWMTKFRPHLEFAQAVSAGRKGIITKAEAAAITRCLHPDNSASTETRNKAFVIWQRIDHLLMSEQDAPTVIPLRRKTAR